MVEEELSVTQAAEVMGVSRSAVQQLVMRGRLPARRIGHVWIIRRADLDAYIEEHAKRRRPGPPGKVGAAA